MANAYKRTRIKTGPHSCINKTQRNDGTTFTSTSNKAGNTTTNISNRGVRKTQTNSGWTQRSFWSGKAPKKRSTKSKSSWSFFSRKKSKTFDSNEFTARLEELGRRMDESPMNMEKWSDKQMWVFIGVVAVICFIIQMAIR